MFYLSSFVWMSIWSLISIFIYYKDKKAAIAGEYRVDELTLDALIVLGGWPGCFIAQRMFKHKTRSAYQRRFRVIVAVWIVLYIGLWNFLWAGNKI
ncbi:DUF1294 domain-containing protein [Salmonella enterica subsp. enterica serovar Panama]|uniref:DUF1294 domain-containing protein n=1 Tax=Enterobacteriaceae TaxID=543 RepID=UPI0014741324|nr:DUF1294 domain-containing protein [Salmonella enterica]EGO0259022.1 DUF1294 domain-containing protein [Salmonella enterica subsp. enterica serovar Panama]EGP7450251.1 DUF1294 domain-containing protein [Salmonella enterica subsp. enterica serovar Panama]NMF70816.1 DUF1294 domain-containing protein [Salmonella enterica subsp. enterica serovar Panama]NMF75540.1 DUF1294 domain-containing protein [Salmonella enterica subsp. enterica serovar Panama]NMF80265.1 DUF1294 domain-containing protein [Sa